MNSEKKNQIGLYWMQNILESINKIEKGYPGLITKETGYKKWISLPVTIEKTINDASLWLF